MPQRVISGVKGGFVSVFTQIGPFTDTGDSQIDYNESEIALE